MGGGECYDLLLCFRRLCHSFSISLYTPLYGLTGQVIVADAGNHCLQIFDYNGRYLSKIPALQKGLKKEDLGGEETFTPCGVAVNLKNNEIVVTDEKNHQVWVFDEMGSCVRRFGEKGVEDGRFDRPTGVVVDREGNLVVADKNNHRVQMFNSDGTFIEAVDFGTEIRDPTGVGVLSDGKIVVSDNGNKRLLLFDPVNQAVQVIDSILFDSPWHLFVDSRDNILVSDYKANAFHVLDGDGSLVKTVQLGSSDGPTGVCVGINGKVLVAALRGKAILSF